MRRAIARSRPRTRLSVLLIGLVLAVGSAVMIVPLFSAPVSAQVQDPLGADIDAILAKPGLAGADVGLVVRFADDNKVLYSRESARRQQPASNAKLVTAAAALEVLRPDYRFITTVATTPVTSGPGTDGPLVGNLYLKGTGDPSMLAADYDALAAKVAASGIRNVNGNLVADDTWFDDVRLGTGWAWDDEPYNYNAQISALTASPEANYTTGAVFNSGSIIVKVSPTEPGQPAKVETIPPTAFVPVASTAVTGQPGSATNLGIDRAHGADTITVGGSIAPGAKPFQRSRTVWDPTGYAAALFRAALDAHGVKVAGPTTRGATPDGADKVADKESAPLSELLVPLFKRSNNMIAETLVKAMGRKTSGEGSWSAGIAAIGTKLKDLGIDSKIYLEEGSGLSRMDHISPDQLASLLVTARSKPWFTTWYDALPIACIPDPMVGGTLVESVRKRLCAKTPTGGPSPAAGNVHAKTGTYTGASGLSGYVTAANGQKLVFSMITNNNIDDDVDLKDLEDEVALRLATYNGSQDQHQPTLQSVPAPHRSTARLGANREANLECSWVQAC